MTDRFINRIIIVILVIVASCFIVAVINEPPHQNFELIELRECYYPKCYDVQIYIDQAGANHDIAFCESSFNPLATTELGSAKGVYQFIDKTWANYCEGDVMNYKDNVDCFLILYEAHPSWWECK